MNVCMYGFPLALVSLRQPGRDIVQVGKTSNRVDCGLAGAVGVEGPEQWAARVRGSLVR